MCPQVPDAAKIRSVAGGESKVWDQPSRRRPVLSQRCAHLSGPRTHSPGHRRVQGWVVDTDRHWAESKACRELQVRPESSCEGRRRPGDSAFPERKAAFRSRPCWPHQGSAVAPLTGSRHLGSAPGPQPPKPPDLPAHRPRFPVPAASLRSGGTPGGDLERGRRPGWGVGQSGRASWRRRRRAPPLLSGTCQCFALGAGLQLRVLSESPGTRAPPASGPFRGSGRPSMLSSPRAGCRGRGRRGGGQARGRGLGARRPVIG